MGRPRDKHYWNQVTKEENGKWKCKHCGHEFSGRISISRIKAHVDRKKGKGTAICSIDHGNEGVRNNMASSPQEAVNRVQVADGVAETINTNQNNTERIHLSDGFWEGLLEGILEGGSGSSYTRSAFESEINHLNQLVSDLQREESDIKEQVQWLQSRGKKRKRQVDIWLNELQALKNRVVDMNNSVDPLPDSYGVEIKQLIEKMQKHKEERPMALSTELVGISFERNIKQVLKLLADDQVFIIGIYGMGGVGKTILASHVENEIKRKGIFKDVFWVTVSHNFSISKLQHDIGKKVGIKLDKVDDERTRASNLSLALEAKEKSVLILDDVWKYIDLQKVGIPLKVNGIKVILTTRLKHVCQQMDCLSINTITMLPLKDDHDEDLKLFMLKLGHNGTPATLPPEVLEIVKSVVGRCNGLPLAISVMARTMKGVDDIHRWKHAWNKLEKLEWGKEVEEEVFKVLKRSYDNLMEKDMQNCFLYGALLFDFERVELIMKLTDKGLISGRSLEEIFDEGHTILDNLEAHSLLGTGLSLHAHRLVTDMACHILKESQRHVMVKHKTRPHMQEWTADLELVYLNRCGIEEIPEGTSPGCPRLSTLIMNGAFIGHIPECFFINMTVLAVLDLSYNGSLESLPNSVSNLRSLISLVLRDCHSLKYVAPLGELQALSRLVISGSLIEQVPQGLETLINLKWLDLSENRNLTLVPGSVLPNLTNMQYLDLRSPGDGAMITLEDVKGMKVLERFGGTFLYCEDYEHYVQETLDTGFGPNTYHLVLGNICDDDYYWEDVELNGIVARKPKVVCFGDCDEFSLVLPRDITELRIYDNNQGISLCNFLSSDASYSLRRIKISNCTQLESLFCSSDSCSLCTQIDNLVSLDLVNLGSLTAVCKEDVADDQLSFSWGGMFSRLKHFYILDCHEIEELLTPGLVLQLRNLGTVTVIGCRSLTEIFAVDNGDGVDDGSTTSIELPKLTTLKLSNLPQLKTVSKGIIFCESAPEVVIDSCPNLERHPTIEVKPFYDSE